MKFINNMILDKIKQFYSIFNQKTANKSFNMSDVLVYPKAYGELPAVFK